MSIFASCPHCHRSGKVPDAAAGKKCKCPKCNQSFIVPTMQPGLSPASLHVLDAVILPSPPHQNLPAIAPSCDPILSIDLAENRFEMDCPFCGESVLMHARKCKHCGETLDLSLRVAEDAEQRRERNLRRRDRGTTVNTTVIVDNRGNRAGFNHGVHLIMCLLTGGLWLPIWILCWLCSGD